MPRKKEQVVPNIQPKAMPSQSSSPPRVRGSSIPALNLPHPFPSESSWPLSFDILLTVQRSPCQTVTAERMKTTKTCHYLSTPGEQ